MNTRLIIDDHSQLRELREPGPISDPVMRSGARIISWIFHPVFLPVYMVIFMVYLHPYLFAGYTPGQRMKTVMMAVLMYTFFPVITVLLLKALDFISSIYLRTQRDRVIPFIATMIWYFWLWYVWKNLFGVDDIIEIPRVAIQFALACFISTIIGLMANIRMKISLHAIAVGVLTTFLLLLAYREGLHFGIYLSIMIFITGLVCTARFIVSDHTSKEIYMGLACGVLSMLLAFWLG